MPKFFWEYLQKLKVYQKVFLLLILLLDRIIYRIKMSSTSVWESSES